MTFFITLGDLMLCLCVLLVTPDVFIVINCGQKQIRQVNFINIVKTKKITFNLSSFILKYDISTFIISLLITEFDCLPLFNKC